MSQTLALHPAKKRDAIFLWVLLGWLAFILLPSWSLDYGLLESTSDEILEAYSWSHFNISWLWYLLPSLLLVRPFNEAKREQRSRHYFDAGWALLCIAFMVISATIVGRGLSYAAIVLFIELSAIMTLALTRLEWLGGDRFVIGSLIAIVALIGIFIVWPSIAIFIPMFANDAGEFAPTGVYKCALAGPYHSGDRQLYRLIDSGGYWLHFLRSGAGDIYHAHR